MAQVAPLTGYTFTDKIDMRECPTLPQPILNCQQDTSDQDKMILGTLNILSGIIPKSFHNIYDHCRTAMKEQLTSSRGAATPAWPCSGP